MRNMIEVRPAPEHRRAFATWAVAQVPKIRTAGPHVFAVPAALFPEAPEEVLIGATVDGHRYVSPLEDAALGTPPPAAPAAQVPAVPVTEWREAMPGDQLPAVPAATYGPDSVPLPPPAGEGSDSSDPTADVPEGVFRCTACGRDFTSERGRDTHLRMKHGG
jgi:hypothetical protein